MWSRRCCCWRKLATGSVLGAAAAERQHVQDCSDVRVILHVGDLCATEREAGRSGNRSDAGGVGKDEFRIREITQRRSGPAVELIEGDDVGLGTVRPGSNGAPAEIV